MSKPQRKGEPRWKRHDTQRPRPSVQLRLQVAELSAATEEAFMVTQWAGPVPLPFLGHGAWVIWDFPKLHMVSGGHILQSMRTHGYTWQN